MGLCLDSNSKAFNPACKLSNCIMLNNLSKKQIAKFKNKGYTKELKLDSKQGIFMKTFNEPIDSLMNMNFLESKNN